MSRPHTNHVNFTASATSAEAKLDGSTLCGMFIPAGFVGTSITFTACDTSGGTFLPVHKDGAALTITVAASMYVALNPNDYAGLKFIKLVSSASETAVVKLAVRAIA